MITALLIAIPFLAAMILPFVPNKISRHIALAIALAEFVLALVAAFLFVPGNGFQFSVDIPWVENLGLRFSAGMDGIGLLLVLLTAFVGIMVVLSTFNRKYEKASTLYALILLMQAGLVGAFTVTNGLLFYVFWEMALVPVYFICALWRGDRPARNFFKFFIYTIFGSFLMLLAFIYLFTQAGSFQMDALYALNLSETAQTWVFWAFFVAFAVKLPIFPLHTWQPDTYTYSPTPATILLSAIMLKMAVYGMLRWMLPIAPDALNEWGFYATLLSVAGIVYASIIALKQNNIKRVAAYASIAHVGLIAAGVFAFTAESLEGSVFQMLSHGLTSIGIFFIADIIFNQTKTLNMNDLGGIAAKAPKLAIVFLITALAMVALPLTSGFWGEFLLLLGLYEYHTVLGIFATLTVILSAVYMLRLYQKTMYGKTNSLTENFRDLSLSEMAVMFPVVAGILLLGLYPNLFLDIARPAVENLMQIIKS